MSLEFPAFSRQILYIKFHHIKYVSQPVTIFLYDSFSENSRHGKGPENLLEFAVCKKTYQEILARFLPLYLEKKG